jgi:hydroxymethylpyrimidine/phosphomethylpyrimidine kinase
MSTAASCHGQPVCLTVAGSDSGGGAGIQADLRAFTGCGTFGTSALTALTAQSPAAVEAVYPVPAAFIADQIAAVCRYFEVAAVKTGMLYDGEVVRAVAAALAASAPEAPLVVDPVLVATSGGTLTGGDVVSAMCAKLLPRAALVTPNLPEAEVFLDGAIAADPVAAAQALVARCGGAPVLLKGGHREQGRGCDILADGSKAWRISVAPIPVGDVHGTGCTLSAAIAARLAGGESLLDAVVGAKRYLTAGLAMLHADGGPAAGVPLPDAAGLAAVAIDVVAC